MLTNKEKYKLYKPKKFLGQNFLVDDNIAKKIIRSLEIEEGDNILEIGPGQEALTKHFIEMKINYAAVELDKEIAETLKIKYKDRLTVIHKDFLKVDLVKDLSEVFDKNKKIKVIGNIPYNITSEILFKLFEARELIHSVVIMMQKEVAERLTAKPDTKDYGILAINTQLNTVPRLLFNVPPTAFFPKPRVNSTVVRLDLDHVTLNVSSMKTFKRVVRDSFGKRRKVMSNSLKEMFEELGISFKSIEFDFSRRPENVTVNEFEDLSNKIDLVHGAKVSTHAMTEKLHGEDED